MIALNPARALVLGSALVLAACGGEGLVLPPEGEPAHINVIHGDGQSGRAGSVLADSVVVHVTDTKDRPVAGATVNFSFPDNDAQAGPATGTTNSDGVTWAKVTLGAPVGPVTGVAEVPVDAGFTPVRVEFTAMTLAGNANGIAAVSGDNQSGPVNSPLPAPLVVRVTDESGNPIPNQPVVWSVPANGGGGSVTPTNTVTDANGEASATRTLGPTAGQQTTLATSEGLAGSPVTFAHTATPGGAAGVNKVSGDNQSAQAGTELSQPLVVQVLDADRNPIPNRAVTWIVTGGGGTVSQENTTTNAQGEASTRWTLGPAAGANSVNAVVSGVGTATFNATGTAGTVSPSNSTATASPGSITAGSGTSTVTVTVRDASNNPIAGVSVSLASSGSGNTINPATAASNSNGVATFTFSSTVAESKTITAVAGGVTIDDQPTITVNKASSTIEITSDEDDPSVVGEAIIVEFTVAGSGGTPTGTVTVTISGGNESCQATLTNGSGSCSLTPLVPGTGTNFRRVITATYGGDAHFEGDSDTDNHRVNPVATPNNPPNAAFNPPSCTVGQPCQFNDGSSDSDGNVVAWAWTFGDGQSSNVEDPTNTYATEGTKQVTLTVTDDDGATSTVTHNVTVAAAPSGNRAPTANPDSYTAQAGVQRTVGQDESLLNNDSDPDAGDVLAAEIVQGPSRGVIRGFDPSGTFDYTPNGDAGGTTDTFTYKLRDLAGAESNVTTVTITITP